MINKSGDGKGLNESRGKSQFQMREVFKIELILKKNMKTIEINED